MDTLPPTCHPERTPDFLPHCTNQRPRMRLSLRKAALGLPTPQSLTGNPEGAGTCGAPFLIATAQACHRPRPPRSGATVFSLRRFHYSERLTAFFTADLRPAESFFTAVFLTAAFFPVFLAVTAFFAGLLRAFSVFSTSMAFNCSRSMVR